MSKNKKEGKENGNMRAGWCSWGEGKGSVFPKRTLRGQAEH